MFIHVRECWKLYFHTLNKFYGIQLSIAEGQRGGTFNVHGGELVVKIYLSLAKY